ncbi:MAG: hypothetical protein EPN97_05540 [Alphaproteobacteria bacterium]|nr:MAG: hypothetical protein EPN97_05540 [Alphaproteobacteria bacterium]
MGFPKRGLRCHFDKKSEPGAGAKRARLRFAPHPALCRKDFGAVCDEKSEKQYLSDLEQVLLTISAMQCIGFGKRHAQDERINRLLLSLMTGERQANSRFTTELQQVVNRRSVRTGQNIATGKPFSCRGKDENPPVRQREQQHRREPRAQTPRPARLQPRGTEFRMTV